MQPLTAPATSSAENIDDVLGRFHAWANAHKATQKTNEMIDGVCEVSYEEALQSSRRRWQTHTATTSPAAHTEQPAAIDFQDDDAIAPDTFTLTAGTEPSGEVTISAGEPHPGSFRTILSQTVSPDVNSGPLALVWPAANKSEHQVSMSLRVAASEQALIKARAAEAGLSASAYLRHCALEVEKLRAQVHHTLALIEQRSSQNSGLSLPSATPQAQAQPRLLTRVYRRIFGQPGSLILRA
jgi:hypothetical protein